MVVVAGGGAVMGAAFITLLPEILGTGASLFAGAYPELSLHILALKE
ncbi:MAG: branched-chain amino acid ABC transporter permease, partial [Calothrix sp. SM1_5_4]|nr:branched-chain amino acid ABC transporter permease [Calothrix sp. SM1_5_4]